MAVYTALTEAQTRSHSVNNDHADITDNTSVHHDNGDNYNSISDNITVIGDNDNDYDGRVIENITTSLGVVTSLEKSASRPDLLLPLPVQQYQPTYHVTTMEAKEEPEKSTDLSVTNEEIPPPSRTPSPITPTCAASPHRNQQRSNLPDLVLDINQQSALNVNAAPCLPDVVPQQKTSRKQSTGSPQRRGSFRIVRKELANLSTPKNSPANESTDEGYHSQTKRFRSNENSPVTKPTRQSPLNKDNTVKRPSRGAQRKLQFQTHPGNLDVLDAWKNIGYQLNRISTSFAARNRLQNSSNTDQHVDDVAGQMSLLSRGYTMLTNSYTDNTNEDELDTISHAQQQPGSSHGSGRKYMAELAVSVVTNAIVFICVRKLQILIF